tara:strand:+ start:380 stop:547 length:168 start_codon:yes stop_codon:yes gene_type:complete
VELRVQEPFLVHLELPYAEVQEVHHELEGELLDSEQMQLVAVQKRVVRKLPELPS